MELVSDVMVVLALLPYGCIEGHRTCVGVCVGRRTGEVGDVDDEQKQELTIKKNFFSYLLLLLRCLLFEIFLNFFYASYDYVVQIIGWE